jgi:hypothetical protein
MNVVIRTKLDTRWRLSFLPLLRIPQPKLPTYLYVEVLALIIGALVLVNWTLLVRQNVQPPNPFSTYTDNVAELTEPIHSATVVHGLNCSVVSLDDHQYCTMSPSNGPFWYVMGIFADGAIRWNGFAVRENTLTLGDLILLWDRPVTHLYQESAVFEWPALGISATGWTDSKQFDYHIPITRVVINRVNG